MNRSIATLLEKPGLKLGHYVGEFTTPGIGYILKEAGCEFVFFDMEHSGNGFETVQRCLRYFEAADLPAFIRIPSGQPHHIARALDAGAQSIVIPMVGSADEAKSIIDAMKFTPLGKRGMAPGLAQDRYRIMPVDAAIDHGNRTTKLVVLIETQEGIDHVDAIAALDGVDVLWVGHFDLTASMGIPGQFDHPDYLRALDTVLAAGKRHNKGLGRMAGDVGSAIALAEQGWDLIMYSGDTWLLQHAIRDGLDAIRAGLAR